MKSVLIFAAGYLFFFPATFIGLGFFFLVSGLMPEVGVTPQWVNVAMHGTPVWSLLPTYVFFLYVKPKRNRKDESR